MIMTKAVLFSTSFSVLLYFAFLYMFKSQRLCELVKHDSRWKWLQPNYICYIRTIMALVAYYFFFYLDWHSSGIFFFTVAATLDGVDGFVAGVLKLITEFGAWLDPICDKITYIPPIFSFIERGVIHVGWHWFVMFVIFEGLGQFYVRRLQRKWKITQAANMFGKVKAVLLFALIIYSAVLMDNLGINNFAGELFCIATVLSFVSAVTKLMPKTIYAYSILGVNLICGVAGIILARNPPSEFFVYMALAVISIEVTWIVSVFLTLKNLRVVLAKIPMKVYILMAALIFIVLSFSLKIEDEFAIGATMITMSTFFITLGRYEIA